jgi:hypothetical protein
MEFREKTVTEWLENATRGGGGASKKKGLREETAGERNGGGVGALVVW